MRLNCCLLAALLPLATFASTASSSDVSATVSVVSGDGQVAAPGSFNPQPFDVAVWRGSGTAPVVGANVTFSVGAGGGLLASSNGEAAEAASTLILTTDAEGTVQAYYRQPAAHGVLSRIRVSSGDASLLLFTSTPGLQSAEASEGVSSAAKKELVPGVAAGGKRRLVADSRGSLTLVGEGEPGYYGTARAITVAASQLKLRVPTKVYTVSTSNWTITASP